MDADAVNRKRIAEECRKRRFFNAKQRQIGLDVEALNYQVHEHLLARAREEERERKFAEEAKRQSDLAGLLEKQKQDESREKSKKVVEFRTTEQRAQSSKEYDLNDPDQKKKEHPAGTDGPSCPISSLQYFIGEDIEYEDRIMKQKEQIHDILNKQILEKRMQKFEKDKERRDWASAMLQQDRYTKQLDDLENKRRKEAFAAMIAENRCLAIQKQEAALRQKIADDFDKRNEILFNEEGYISSENPLLARSSIGPNRVATDRWRGMSKEQLKQIHDIQKQQISDNQTKKLHERMEAQQWHEQFLSQEDATRRLEEEEKNRKQKLNEKVNSTNELLAQEQKRKQEYLDKVVYTNVPTKEFFEQFNTTSR